MNPGGAALSTGAPCRPLCDLLRQPMLANQAWTADLKMALDHGGSDAAWQVLNLRADEWLGDREVALQFAAVTMRFPTGATLTTLEAIAAAFPSDGQVTVAVLAALNAMAELRPLDAPPRDHGPEHVAAELSKDALTRSFPPELEAYLQINRANALRAMGPESDSLALEAYARALELEPDHGGWHFDLGVCHKWRGRWQLAFDQFLRARSRMGATKAVLWNMALSATALGEGDLAAGAWRDLGVENISLGKGGLPLVEGVPTRRVRVRCRPSGYGLVERPDTGFELVHIASISPGHGVVASPTFEDTPLDYGDIVLFDGAPVDHDAEGPVFPVLEVLRAGDEQRLRFVAIVGSGELEALVSALGENIRAFAHPATSEPKPNDDQLIYGKLIASADVNAAQLCQRLEAHGKDTKRLRIAVPELYEATGDTRRAGQEHQTWRGIERVAVKRGLTLE
ncbi:MAG: hypothetical protein ACI9KE_003241 [Polyangiales bacterium]